MSYFCHKLEITMEVPTFVHRDGMIADKKYVEWLKELKLRFMRSQAKTAVKVNSAMLEFYWSIGRDLVNLRAEERWGAGVVKQFSLDMREAFPNSTGFSHTNVKYMKRWYLFYRENITKSQRPVDPNFNLIEDGNGLATKGQRPIDLLEMPEIFGQVPWGQTH